MCDTLNSAAFDPPVQSQEISTKATHGRKSFITTKLVLALNRCQLSMRVLVFIIQATIEALEMDTMIYR